VGIQKPKHAYRAGETNFQVANSRCKVKDPYLKTLIILLIMQPNNCLNLFKHSHQPIRFNID